MRSEPTWLGDQLFQGKARSRTFGQGAIGGNARESRHANHTRTHAMRTAAKGQHDRRRMAFFLARRREERTHVKFNRFAHDCKSRRAVPWSSLLCRKGIYRDIGFPATLANKPPCFRFCASRNAGRARITEMRRFPSHNYSSLSTHARFPGKPIGIGKENRTHAFCHGLSGSNWHSIRQARISMDLSHNLDPKSRSGAARRPPRG